MSHAERLSTDPAVIADIIDRADVCRLGLCDRDRPYVVPVAFGFVDGALYFHTAPDGRKIDILNRNPRVCFEMDIDVKLMTHPGKACRWTFLYSSVIGEGRAVELVDDAERRSGLNAIMRHYSGRDWEYGAAALAETAVWRVDVESLTGKRYTGKRPAAKPGPVKEPAAEPEVEIRPAQDGDVDRLLAFATDLFAEKLPTLPLREEPYTREMEAEFIAEYSADPGALLLLAIRGDEVVSVLNFKPNERSEEAHGGVFGISTAKPWRGRGVGSRLIRELIERAPALGIRRIGLETFANNPGAMRLYQRLGFEHEGVRRAGAMIGGEPVDIIQMALLLDGGE